MVSTRHGGRPAHVPGCSGQRKLPPNLPRAPRQSLEHGTQATEPRLPRVPKNGIKPDTLTGPGGCQIRPTSTIYMHRGQPTIERRWRWTRCSVEPSLGDGPGRLAWTELTGVTGLGNTLTRCRVSPGLQQADTRQRTADSGREPVQACHICTLAARNRQAATPSTRC